MSTTKEFYKTCNLQNNPFRENPAVASHERAALWVGYDGENRKLRRVLNQARSDQLGNTRFFCLYGGFGTGKSHALLWAQNLILHKEEQEFNACAYYIKSLKTQGGRFSFYRAFQEYIINQSDILKDLEEFHNHLHDRINFYKREYKKPTQQNPLEIIEEIFKAPELVSLASKLYQASSPKEREAAISVNDDFDSILRFTNLVKLFTFNIPSPTEDDNQFKKAVYLFIDELDDLAGAPVKDARIVNDHLRHLYDNCQGCFCLGIALSAEISELTMYFQDFVLSRIDRTIELALLDKTQAMEFILGMLESKRIKANNSYFPFEDQTVEHIVDQIAQLTPRKIVKAMYETIETVRLEEYDPSSD